MATATLPQSPSVRAEKTPRDGAIALAPPPVAGTGEQAVYWGDWLALKVWLAGCTIMWLHVLGNHVFSLWSR